jgi:imidazolonepropionase-like amidohydrolase
MVTPMSTPRLRITAAIAALCCAACGPQGDDASSSRVGAVPAGGLVITNARVLDGAGGVLDGATVVVRDGRIVSVGATPPDAEGALQLDAGGMTVMPGLIDGHRHLISGDGEAWLRDAASDRMREYHEAGFTTVLSAIDDEDAILELRRRVAEGELVGPRILAAAVAPVSRPPAGGGRGGRGGDPARGDQRAPRQPGALAIPPEETSARIQQIADRGFDAVKVILAVTPGGPEQATLARIVEEADRLGLQTITHAVSVEDTLAAVAAGTTMLVHTPHVGQLTLEQAATIGGAGIPMTSTLGVFVPFFDDENEPIFRDALPYPWENLLSAGQGPVNARLLWEAGLVYGFGTDTSFLPRETLRHELTSLSPTFSPRDLVSILTRNAAIAIGREADIGTIEPGRIADLLVVDGDPATDIYDVLEVAMVVKDGQVVVDNGRLP